MKDCLIVSTQATAFAEEISRLSQNGDILVFPKACSSETEALENYAGQPILFGNPAMIAAILPEMPAIKWVQSTWAGVTPLTALDRRDYTLTGVKDVFGPQISEYVMGYLLAHELKVLERMEQQRQGKWFDVPSGVVHGKRMGVMGTGSIGAHIARTARVFGISTVGLNLSGEPSKAFDEVMPVTRLHEFLDGLDYLVSTLPQTESTDRLLDGAALKRLPAHAYFVNVGRGNVIDDVALVDALRNETLAGAALDVFDEEPIPQGSPLWHAPNVSISAHIAAISHPSLIAPIFVENYQRYHAGQPLNHVVDFDKGY